MPNLHARICTSEEYFLKNALYDTPVALSRRFFLRDPKHTATDVNQEHFLKAVVSKDDSEKCVIQFNVLIVHSCGTYVDLVNRQVY